MYPLTILDNFYFMFARGVFSVHLQRNCKSPPKFFLLVFPHNLKAHYGSILVGVVSFLRSFSIRVVFLLLIHSGISVFLASSHFKSQSVVDRIEFLKS